MTKIKLTGHYKIEDKQIKEWGFFDFYDKNNKSLDWLVDKMFTEDFVKGIFDQVFYELKKRGLTDRLGAGFIEIDWMTKLVRVGHIDWKKDGEEHEEIPFSFQLLSGKYH